MARVTTYLNFKGTTEAAMTFYKGVFGTDFVSPLQRFGDMPAQPGQPALPPDIAKQVLHVALPILAGHVLMASDAPDGMAPPITWGNNVYINLEPDTRADADRLFKGLSEGGKVETPLQEMFWGAYYGVFVDKFGVQWSINCMAK
jgi:PhnB protein